MADSIFVYGTLQLDLAPEKILPALSRLSPVGPGWVQGLLYDLGDFPGLVLTPPGPGEPGPEVKGVVYLLPGDPEILDALDRYEGFEPRDPSSSLFIRERAPVRLEAGGEISAWVYRYARDPGGAVPIPSGDYRTYLRGRRKR